MSLSIFLCGDVMTGRGIDQILPYPCDPSLYESYVKDARDYVSLAEQVNGRVPHPVDFSYIWGEALELLKRKDPEYKIINLETSVTRHEVPWPGKGIHYRMSPENVPCLTAVGIDCCALANNHLLDWGREGMLETLHALKKAGIATAGAGRDRKQATAPAILESPLGGRLLVFSVGLGTSGVPAAWQAGRRSPGVYCAARPNPKLAEDLAFRVAQHKGEGDFAILSIHWGGNWGFEVPEGQRDLAHKVIDQAGIDLVHGHSSHHVKGIEVYKNRLILYGCGDFITDYEGIRGHESYRGELSLMYFPVVDSSTGRLLSLTMEPTRMKRLQLLRTDEQESRWLMEVLNRQGRPFGTQVERGEGGEFNLLWASAE